MNKNKTNNKVKLNTEERQLLEYLIDEGVFKIAKAIQRLYPDDYRCFINTYLETINMNKKLQDAINKLVK